MARIPPKRPDVAGDTDTEVTVLCDSAKSKAIAVTLKASDITMWVYSGDYAPGVTEPEWSYYEFKCPYCFARHVKSASREIFEALRAAVRVIEIPPEAVEPHAGPPITYDDVLEFHLEAG